MWSLPKKSAFIKKTDFIKKNGIDYKTLHCRPSIGTKRKITVIMNNTNFSNEFQSNRKNRKEYHSSTQEDSMANKLLRLQIQHNRVHQENNTLKINNDNDNNSIVYVPYYVKQQTSPTHNLSTSPTQCEKEEHIHYINNNKDSKYYTKHIPVEFKTPSNNQNISRPQNFIQLDKQVAEPKIAKKIKPTKKRTKKRVRKIVNYDCTECGRVLGSKGGLIQHMRIHTGERPFKCSICSRTFTQKSSLNRHKKRVHRNITENRQRISMVPSYVIGTQGVNTVFINGLQHSPINQQNSAVNQISPVNQEYSPTNEQISPINQQYQTNIYSSPVDYQYIAVSQLDPTQIQFL